MLHAIAVLVGENPSTFHLPQGGRLHAQTDRVKAAYAEQGADYRNTVLTAYEEVEDNLAALRQMEAETQTAAVTASTTALQLGGGWETRPQ